MLCMSRPFKKFTTTAAALVFSLFTQVHGAPGGTTNSLPAFTGEFLGEAPPPSEPLSLWYRQPATNWVSALPVGNGRLGAMVFGGIASEKLQLNEDTLWAGGPYDPDNTNALAALPEVRRLIFDGKYAEAQKLAGEKMMGKPCGKCRMRRSVI
jgi:alpha-L-fucosidase 2